MNWFYAVNSQQAGPVSEAQLEELLQSGKINQDTLIWREGMANWQPLRVARPGAPSVPPMINGQQGMTCAECGQVFPAGDVIRLNNSWVCASCKPIFLQRLREGVMPNGAAGGLWRTKNTLVTRSETPFPDRCVRCNAPANGFRLKRKLYWHPPGYFALVAVNLLVYAIVAMCVRKNATLYIGLCERHRARRKQGMIVCWTGVAVCIAMMIGAGVAHSGSMVVLGIVLLLGTLIYGGVTGARVSPAKLRRTMSTLRE